ncbi:MAG: DNA starvation/stationary phase protection protein [Bacteroidales bacterium]|nr:DNA starvation/stationary phase protection protein [Bacteroidales bacterium]
MSNQNTILLQKDKADQTAEKLNDLLANMQVTYMNVRGYHWNIKGKQFFVLHEKFEELYDDLAEKIDEVAERILMLEGKPLHSFTDYLKVSQIKEDTDVSTSEKTVSSTIEGLQTLLSKEREILASADEAGDEGTIDLISGYISEQEKLIWMFSAFNK